MHQNNWKKLLTQYLIAAILALTFTGCAGNKVQVKPYSDEDTIHYKQLNSYDVGRNLNNYVFYVNKGDTIPLKLSMETDFMEFKQDQIDIVAKEKLYFMIEMPENLSVEELAQLNKLDARSFSKMTNKQRTEFLEDYMLYVSKDAVHWAPLFGSRAYREILGYKAGLLSFAILANTSDGLGASLDIRTVK